MSSQSPGGHSPRLEFLKALGLVPPVTVEDVKQAYLEKVKTAHPDAGGTAEKFVELQRAFEQATEYARFKASRMQWLTRWVEKYAEQQQVIKDLEALGAQVDVESSEWMADSIGDDFATVLEQVVGLRFNGPAIDDRTLIDISTHARAVAGLRRLALINTQVSSVGLRQLHSFQSLQELDLTGTRVSLWAVQSLLAQLRMLQKIVLEGTAISWWERTKLRWKHRSLEILP